MVSENIKIKIPKELLDKGSSDKLNYSFVEGKTILGLSGYARSGKDTIGKLIVEKCGFKRFSFGDVLKTDLNIYLKEEAFKEITANGNDVLFEDIDFLNPKDIKTKEVLRPYMIWFGEEMKRVNGKHHWTNRVFSDFGSSEKNVITDIRRINELEIFELNKNKNNTNTFKSLLVYISQYNLSDEDFCTLEAIRIAHERWLFDHTIFVDSTIFEELGMRERHMNGHVINLIAKFPKFFL